MNGVIAVITVAELIKGKFAGIDNKPTELVQAGVETIFDVLTKICYKVWRTEECLTQLTQSLIITLPKGQPTALPELKNHKRHQSYKQRHAESHLEQAKPHSS